MMFFVHKESLGGNYFSLLEEASKEFDNIELEVIDESYKGTQPTTWRMKPLWDKSVDYLFCRDVEYAINKLERKSVEYFIGQDKCCIHGIRSYHLHTTPYMAGMCGFEVKKVREKIKNLASSFEEYIDFGVKNVGYCKDWIWGCDQALLRDFFGKCGMFNLTLDCPQFTAPERVTGFNAVLCLPSEYEDVEIPFCNNKMLEFSNSLSGFTGLSFICDGRNFDKILECTDNKLSKLVKKHMGRK